MYKTQDHKLQVKRNSFHYSPVIAWELNGTFKKRHTSRQPTLCHSSLFTLLRPYLLCMQLCGTFVMEEECCLHLSSSFLRHGCSCWSIWKLYSFCYSVLLWILVVVFTVPLFCIFLWNQNFYTCSMASIAFLWFLENVLSSFVFCRLCTSGRMASLFDVWERAVFCSELKNSAVEYLKKIQKIVLSLTMLFNIFHTVGEYMAIWIHRYFSLPLSPLYQPFSTTVSRHVDVLLPATARCVSEN